MSTINASTHPFYDKHDDLIKSIWNIDKNELDVEKKLSKLKEIVSSKNPSQLCEIFDEKTGEARAKVTPLIIACFEGDYQTIEFLLNSGADPNQCESEHDLTALHILVDGPYKGQTISEKQRADLIRQMVVKGADVNHPDKHKMTPIHKCVINDRLECLDALIESNVEPNVVFMGETALSIAARQNRDKIMKKLLNYSKIDKNVRNESGGTILHFAAAGMVDSPECVDLLISSGLPTDIQDQRGNTPTIVACFFNKPRILQSLVAANADLTLKNNEGKDAKAICEERDVPECLQIIEKK